MPRINQAEIEKMKKEMAAKGYTIISKSADVDYLLQSRYGGKKDGDCVLVSITNYLYTIFDKNGNTYKIYDKVLKSAKKRFYNPNGGTLQLFISAIVAEVAREMYNKKVMLAQVLRPNLSRTKGIIDTRKVCILSTRKHNYYGNHTVLCVGYTYFEKGNDRKLYLEVADNWHTTPSYIDFNDLKGFYQITY